MTKPDLTTAAARGDLGMMQATEHADRVEPSWSAQAIAAIRVAVLEAPATFTFEDLRMRAEAFVPVPPDRRAWGTVARRAVLDGLIIATGNFAPRASGNCAPTMVYRRPIA